MALSVEVFTKCFLNSIKNQTEGKKSNAEQTTKIRAVVSERLNHLYEEGEVCAGKGFLWGCKRKACEQEVCEQDLDENRGEWVEVIFFQNITSSKDDATS